jgi:hypothetical protein
LRRAPAARSVCTASNFEEVPVDAQASFANSVDDLVGPRAKQIHPSGCRIAALGAKDPAGCTLLPLWAPRREGNSDFGRRSGPLVDRIQFPRYRRGQTRLNQPSDHWGTQLCHCCSSSAWSAERTGPFLIQHHLHPSPIVSDGRQRLSVGRGGIPCCHVRARRVAATRCVACPSSIEPNEAANRSKRHHDTVNRIGLVHWLLAGQLTCGNS